MNHDSLAGGAPEPLSTAAAAELANTMPETLECAYAAGRADQLDDDRRLLAWAYGHLRHFTFPRQEDALAMDEIKLMLMGAS